MAFWGKEMNCHVTRRLLSQKPCNAIWGWARQQQNTPCLVPLPQVKTCVLILQYTTLVVSFKPYSSAIVGPRRNICVSSFVL
jgi:hypothetical protein